MGISLETSGIKVGEDKCFLVNLNADPALNELLVYYLKVMLFLQCHFFLSSAPQSSRFIYKANLSTTGTIRGDAQKSIKQLGGSNLKTIRNLINIIKINL